MSMAMTPVVGMFVARKPWTRVIVLAISMFFDIVFGLARGAVWIKFVKLHVKHILQSYHCRYACRKLVMKFVHHRALLPNTTSIISSKIKV